MQQFTASLDKIVTLLGLDGCDNIKPLKDLTDKVKLPVPLRPAYVVLLVFAISILMIVVGLASALITTVLGMLYPAYKSIKAIEASNIINLLMINRRKNR